MLLTTFTLIMPRSQSVNPAAAVIRALRALTGLNATDACAAACNPGVDLTFRISDPMASPDPIARNLWAQQHFRVLKSHGVEVKNSATCVLGRLRELSAEAAAYGHPDLAAQLDQLVTAEVLRTPCL